MVWGKSWKSTPWRIRTPCSARCNNEVVRWWGCGDRVFGKAKTASSPHTSFRPIRVVSVELEDEHLSPVPDARTWAVTHSKRPRSSSRRAAEVRVPPSRRGQGRKVALSFPLRFFSLCTAVLDGQVSIRRRPLTKLAILVPMAGPKFAG
jgi:hypothetical protein